MKHDIRMKDRDWSANLWSRIRAIFTGLDDRVTALEHGGGGGGGVTGVKGASESTYRTGNVSLSPSNIGALSSNGYTDITGSIMRVISDTDITDIHNGVSSGSSVKSATVIGARDGAAHTVLQLVAAALYNGNTRFSLSLYNNTGTQNQSFGGYVDLAKDGSATVYFNNADAIKNALHIVIPSKTSDLTNDSGFITAADVDTMGFYIDAQGYVCQQITGDTQGG